MRQNNNCSRDFATLKKLKILNKTVFCNAGAGDEKLVPHCFQVRSRWRGAVVVLSWRGRRWASRSTTVWTLRRWCSSTAWTRCDSTSSTPRRLNKTSSGTSRVSRKSFKKLSINEQSFLSQTILEFWSSLHPARVNLFQPTLSLAFCDGSPDCGSWCPRWEEQGHSGTSPTPPSWRRKSLKKPGRSGRWRTIQSNRCVLCSFGWMSGIIDHWLKTVS